MWEENNIFGKPFMQLLKRYIYPQYELSMNKYKWSHNQFQEQNVLDDELKQNSNIYFEFENNDVPLGNLNSNNMTLNE
jgi:hypothetical protein